MSFKFRLETSLRLAEQEMDIMRSSFAQQTRILLSLIEQTEAQKISLKKAWQGQRRACTEDPWSIGDWQRYAEQQKRKLLEYQEKVQEQQKIVDKYRKELIECRIKVEKYQRLKEKKKRLFYIEEIRKEQKQLDEIGQRCVLKQK